MALETGTFINDLVSANPTSSDSAAQGDDHIRLIKTVLKNTFPNLTGAVTGTQADLNNILTSAAKTLKGNKEDTSGDTVDVTVADLKTMMGLGGAAFEPLATFATAGHNHDADYAATSHTHDAGDIISGEIAEARLPISGINKKGIVEKATTGEMDAGTANKFPDAEKVKAYVDGTGSITSNGWTKMPNGLIMQWGKITGIVTNQKKTVSFPKAFDTQAFVVNVTPIGLAASGDFEVDFYSVGAKIENNTQFSIVSEGTSSPVTEAYWMAIGK